MPQPSPLSQSLVTRWAKLRALRNLIDKWLAAHRPTILAALERGTPCPERGPYLLLAVEVVSPISWKQEFAEHLTREHGWDDATVATYFQAIEARDRGTSTRVDSRPNPHYRRPFPIHLPK